MRYLHFSCLLMRTVMFKKYEFWQFMLYFLLWPSCHEIWACPGYTATLLILPFFLPILDCINVVPLFCIILQSVIFLYHFLSEGGFLYSLGGYDGNTYLNTMECYNSCTKQWSHVAPMHYSRSCFAAAVCDGYLYALGGYGPSYLRTVERYDPSSNSWEMMPAMSTYRINFGVGVLNGCLYVVGENTFYYFLAFLLSS